MSIVAFAAVVRVRDDVGDYMVSWITVIGVMNIGALTAALAALVSRAAVARVTTLRVNWLAPALGSICLIAASAHGLIDLERIRAERTTPRTDVIARLATASTRRCTRFSRRRTSAAR